MSLKCDGDSVHRMVAKHAEAYTNVSAALGVLLGNALFICIRQELNLG